MIIAILIILGLCLGSFANAYIWRSSVNQKKLKKTNRLSVWRGRSVCPNCKHTLAGKDLIPIFSWLMLKGKCRYCHKPISPQYPLVEFSTAFLFVFSYIYWPYHFDNQGVVLFIIWLAFLLGFVLLTIYDLRWRLLPNNIVFILIALASAQILIKLIFFNAGAGLIVGALWGVIFSAGVFYLLFVVSRGKWIGGGDVKLAIALGLLLGGPAEAILMVFLASLIGSFISITLIVTKKASRTSLVPFGPLLMLATIICYLFGIHIIDWYKHFVI